MAFDKRSEGLDVAFLVGLEELLVGSLGQGWIVNAAERAGFGRRQGNRSACAPAG
jgi:hypothetical protein